MVWGLGLGVYGFGFGVSAAPDKQLRVSTLRDTAGIEGKVFRAVRVRAVEDSGAALSSSAVETSQDPLC